MKKKPYPPLPIMLVDDDALILKSHESMLNSEGMNNIILCRDERKVMPILSEKTVGAIFLDLVLPHVSGEELLSLVKENHPEVPVIITTGINEVDTAVRCIKGKAYDYLVKPVNASRLLNTAKRAMEFREMCMDITLLKGEMTRLKDKIGSDGPRNPVIFKNMVTANTHMLSIFKFAEQIAVSQIPILITGETGVGKDLLAEAIHKASGRKGNLVTINAAAHDDDHFSDTLFGHVKGAFTGTSGARSGHLEKAAGGTLFLDEIGDLSLISQVKLLRVLEQQEYTPLGFDGVKKTDARIIAATNRNLWKRCDEGKFREDLIFRLETHTIQLPPLRQRISDIPLLVKHFVLAYENETGKPAIEINEKALHLLKSYSFPGNVRELKNMVYSAAGHIGCGDTPLEIFKSHMRRKRTVNSDDFSVFETLPSLKAATELLYMEAIRRAKGNQREAAKMLGISQQAVSKWLRRQSQ